MSLQIHQLHKLTTLRTLEDYKIEIIKEVDGVALRVGRLLREAKQADPNDYERWVIEELPFGMETARRLSAISAAYEKLPPETLRGLPRPWQAMYALKELPPHVLMKAIKSGDIHPDMTVESAKNYASKGRTRLRNERKQMVKYVGRLLRSNPSDLQTRMREDLRSWLDRA